MTAPRDWRAAELYRARCRTALTEARRAVSRGDAEAAGRHLQDAITWRRLAQPLAARSRAASDLAEQAHPGIRWWNALTRAERLRWLEAAGSDCPADAWEVFKRERRLLVDNVREERP